MERGSKVECQEREYIEKIDQTFCRYQGLNVRLIRECEKCMSKEEFIALTGEDPEDMFGPDWENEVEELGLTPEDVQNNK